LNDLENIPAFIFVSFLWVLTEPDIVECHVLMWLFTFARYMHTAVYAYYPVPQPARAICFFVGVLITMYTVIMIFVKYGPWLALPFF
jgi:glutathione S-transferase